MMEMDLINILDDVTDEEFKSFKWFLKNEQWNGIEPIRVNQLSKAERCDALDLMVQKYEMKGTLQVMENVLRKINRNDLVRKLPKVPDEAAGLPDPGPAKTANISAEEKLTSVRSQFIDRVSEPVLRKLLDKLLERRVIIDDEMDLSGAKSRADKARQVIDIVRGKGSSASSALIGTLCDVDRCLAEQLQLM